MSTIAELAVFLAREDHAARTAMPAAPAVAPVESPAPPIKGA